MEKKARFGTGEGHTVLDKDNLAVPERYVLPQSGKGVQLPFQTTPDSPRVIPAQVIYNISPKDWKIFPGSTFFKFHYIGNGRWWLLSKLEFGRSWNIYQ